MVNIDYDHMIKLYAVQVQHGRREEFVLISASATVLDEMSHRAV